MFRRWWRRVMMAAGVKPYVIGPIEVVPVEGTPFFEIEADIRMRWWHRDEDKPVAASDLYRCAVEMIRAGGKAQFRLPRPVEMIPIRGDE